MLIAAQEYLTPADNRRWESLFTDIILYHVHRLQRRSITFITSSSFRTKISPLRKKDLMVTKQSRKVLHPQLHLPAPKNKHLRIFSDRYDSKESYLSFRNIPGDIPQPARIYSQQLFPSLHCDLFSSIHRPASQRFVFVDHSKRKCRTGIACLYRAPVD